MSMVESVLYGIIAVVVLYKLAAYEEPKNETPEQRKKRNSDAIW